MEALPSLPPGVRGPVQGVLTLEIGTVAGAEADEALVKFYGAQRAERVRVPGKAVYAIRSPRRVFAGYLEDMQELRVDVAKLDKVMGSIIVDFRPYVSMEAEPLRLQGKFPIFSEVQIGEMEITARTNYETWEDDLEKASSVPEATLDGTEKPFPTANFVGNMEIVRLPRSAIRRIERPVSKASDLSKKSSISDSQLFESLQKREETLRKLMTAREVNPEIDGKRESSPQRSIPLLPLPAIKHLKLQVQSLTVLDSSLVKDRVLVLDCSIPSLSLQPGLKLHQAAQNRYEANKPASLETINLRHRGGSGNVYTYEHESWHTVSVENIGAMANLAVTFKMRVEKEEVGRGEVMWATLLAAPGRVYSTVLALKASGLKQGLRVGNVGLLSVRFELLVEAAKQEVEMRLPTAVPNLPLMKEPDKQIIAEVSSPEAQTKEQPTPQAAVPAVQVAYQLYLYVENAYQVDPRPDSTLRNLFIRYKSLFDSEFITTSVLWEWKDSLQFNHMLMVPILPSDKVINRISTGRLNLEVWDKHSASENELLGLVALPLQAFAEALKAGNLSNSVYPLIAVDDYRAVHSFQSERDVGYLRVCLALGTSAQIQRLNERYKQSKQPAVAIQPAATAPSRTAESAVQTLTVDKTPVKPQRQQSPAKVTDSLESIGDITAFLNRKSTETLPPSKPLLPPNNPPTLSVPAPIPESIIEPVNIDKVLDKLAMRLADMDLEAALQVADVFNSESLHREAFISLMDRLKIGLTSDELYCLSDYILRVSDLSTFRKMRHCDILSALKIAQKRKMCVKHIFTVTLEEISSCKILGFLPVSAYLRVRFPLDDCSYESSLLGQASSQSLSLTSTHSCTVSQGQKLEDYMSIDGLEIWLCKNEKRSETQVLGKALLPVEEVVELAENGKRMTRTLCIYADYNPDIVSFPADIIGKIHCHIVYSEAQTFDPPGTTSEVPWGHRISSEVQIPTSSLLSLSILSASSLQRGLDYYSDQGVNLGPWLQGYVRVSLFHESEELRRRLEDVNTRVVDGKGSLHFQQRFQLEVVLEADVLEYIRKRTAYCELVLKAPEGELVFGALNIPLLPILLSDIRGEFSLQNIYGQHMGTLNIVLSLNKEDIRLGTELPTSIPLTPAHIEEPTKVPTPLPPPQQLLPVKQADCEKPKPLVKLLIAIEAGLRIGSFLFSAETICPYLKLFWQGREVASSSPAQATTYPSWDFAHIQEVFNYDQLREKSLVVEAAYKPSKEGKEVSLGLTEVDLTPLLQFQDISGWYQVLHREAPAGQLKVRISPLDLESVLTVSNLRTQKPIMAVNPLLANDDEDLMAVHTAKMQALDQLTATLRQKYKLAV